jgi:hypothetical protein
MSIISESSQSLSGLRGESKEPDERQSLHDEFRCLTMLLTFVATINHGHPTLPTSHGQWYHGPLESHQPNRPVALNAVAAILVRDWEVVAVAVEDKLSLARTAIIPEGMLPADTAYRVFAVVDEQSLDSNDVPSGLSRFMTLTNPNKQDEYFKTADDATECVLVGAGTSYWQSLLADDWFGVNLM